MKSKAPRRPGSDRKGTIKTTEGGRSGGIKGADIADRRGNAGRNSKQGQFANVKATTKVPAGQLVGVKAVRARTQDRAMTVIDEFRPSPERVTELGKKGVELMRARVRSKKPITFTSWD